MRVLRLRAVHFDDSAGVAEKDFGRGFHNARLSRASRPQEKKISNWASGRIHSGGKDLIEVNHGADAFLLPDDAGAQGGIKLLRFATSALWIKKLGSAAHRITLVTCGPVRAPFRGSWLP